MTKAELFIRKFRDEKGNEHEEEWVVIRKANGRLIKQMSLEDYLKTNRYHPAII